MNWTSGYVSEVDYTHGYYRELSPSLLRLACLSAGVAPSPSNRFTYLELGFGQGLSINIHAAAMDGDFWGTDFNPNQAAQARSLVDASGSGATLLDDSFADLAARSDLPEFDIIALHGIWTWISQENRRVIVDLIRRKLRVGGIAYISYNCLPGWAPAIPLRHLMSLHAELAGSEATGYVGKIDDALRFTQQVVDSGARYFKANPAVGERLKLIVGQNRNYVAHEYFNRHWDVMAFSDVARMVEEAKLSFVASSHLIDHVEAVNLSEAGQKLLSSINQPILRQSVRDYFINQQFRRDIFSKGMRRLSKLEQAEAFRQQKFALLIRAEDVPMKVMGALGEGALQETIYRPVIDSLAHDGYAPKSLAQIAAHPKLASQPFSRLIEVLLVLTGAGHVHPAHEPARHAKTRCASLNRALCQRARSSGDVTFLASPVVALGVPVLRFQQLFLLAAQQGKKTPSEQATFTWNILAAQGQRITKGGKTLDSAEENLAELTLQAEEFSAKRLPLLTALGVSL
jgi:hypothetical protein